MAKQTRAIIIAVFLFPALVLGGCSGAPKMEEHPMLFPSSAHSIPAKKLWSKKVPGLLTDLNLSRDGSTVLVATVPDRDALEAGANRTEHYGVWYSAAGK